MSGPYQCLMCCESFRSHTVGDKLPARSLWMTQRDNHPPKFCTMRCAALYGIRAASIDKVRVAMGFASKANAKVGK